MWRPKDWTNPYPAYPNSQPYDHDRIYEAGADAMLDALRGVHSLEGFERMTEVIL